MTIYVWIVIAYGCGAIPFGKLIGYAYHTDIQKRGSGNIGFANVRRTLGWPAALITLAGDSLKGFLPTYLATSTVSHDSLFWIGLAAVLGHIFPVWLRFRGGKGVATAWGVLLAIQPVAALIGGGTYVVCCLLVGKSSTGSIIGAILAAAIAIKLEPALWWQFAGLLLVITWALRHNILGRLPNYG